ncbi:Rpn family recombination-promoting nuclease/putative transposase [Haliangium sp.]|uniref:Rpn family recombination-promoting nuclease/putative transposase n=1 Tax=Haliangium sp. TaxID=2663208 RepID=UPI003D123F1C
MPTDLRERTSDLLFDADLPGAETPLSIVLEHQSTSERFMAWRAHRYSAAVMSDYLRSNEHAQGLP